jgi:hypothetical protein
MMTELGVWLVRVASFLPELIGLYEASKSADSKDHLNASLALVRKMKDRQAREEIDGA